MLKLDRFYYKVGRVLVKSLVLEFIINNKNQLNHTSDIQDRSELTYITQYWINYFDRFFNEYIDICDNTSTKTYSGNKVYVSSDMVENVNIHDSVEKFYKLENANRNPSDFYEGINTFKELIAKQIVLEEKVLDICKVYHHQNQSWSEAYIKVLNNLALSYLKYNKLSTAIKLQEKALFICANCYHEETPDIWAELYIQSLNSLATLYKNKGNSTQVIALEEELQTICSQFYVQHPDRGAKAYIEILNSLALSYYKDLNLYRDALTLMEKAKTICEEYYDENSESWSKVYSQCLNNIAFLYKDDSTFEKNVSKIEKQTQDICKRYYKLNPDEWAEPYSHILSNLSFSFYKNDNLAKAIELAKQAQNIRLRYYRTDPDNWAELYSETLNNLALLYKKNNEPTKSNELFKEAKTICFQYIKSYQMSWAKKILNIIDKNLGSSESQSLSVMVLDKEPHKTLNFSKDSIRVSREIWH